MRALLRSASKSVYVSSLFIREYLDFCEKLTVFVRQRIIRLGGAVDDDSCNLIVAQLLWLDAVDPTKVRSASQIE